MGLVLMGPVPLAAAAKPEKPARAPMLGIGGLAPEAAGLVLQGPEHIRLSDLRGKVVVLDFWASWCAPCLESMPRLDALRQRLHAQGHAQAFEVLAVGVDREVELARRFLNARPVSYPVIADPQGETMRRFQVWRLPASYIIGADGRISMIYYGYGPDFVADVEQRVRELLARGSPSPP